MTGLCILDGKKRGGCRGCSDICAHKIALHGLNGSGGRVGAAGVPKDYRYYTLANSPAREGQAKIYGQLAQYVSTFERQFDADAERIKSLYLWSESPGTGKTTTASALLNEYLSVNYIGSLKRGLQPAQRPAYYLDTNEWQTDYNNFNRPRVPEAISAPAAARYYKAMELAKHAPFTVLDDIGVRDCTEGFRGDLHAIINHRTTNGMPTVYTSNLPMYSTVPTKDRIEALKPYDLVDVFKEPTPRLVDRINDQCLTLFFSGSSKRGRR